MAPTRIIPDASASPEDAAATTSAPADEATGPAATPTEAADLDEAWAHHLRESIPSLFAFATMNAAFPEILERSYVY